MYRQRQRLLYRTLTYLSDYKQSRTNTIVDEVLWAASNAVRVSLLHIHRPSLTCSRPRYISKREGDIEPSWLSRCQLIYITLHSTTSGRTDLAR